MASEHLTARREPTIEERFARGFVLPMRSASLRDDLRTAAERSGRLP